MTEYLYTTIEEKWASCHTLTWRLISSTLLLFMFHGVVLSQENQASLTGKVEDSDNGIRAAQAAGIQAIAFDDPRYHPQRTAPGVIGVTSFQQVVPTATGISITD